jgi:hypothetical protein
MRILLVVTVIFLPLMFITQYFGGCYSPPFSLDQTDAIYRHELCGDGFCQATLGRIVSLELLACSSSHILTLLADFGRL